MTFGQTRPVTYGQVRAGRRSARAAE